jgi:hypothetical protein
LLLKCACCVSPIFYFSQCRHPESSGITWIFVIPAQAGIQKLSRAKHANISAARVGQTGFPPARERR